MGLEIGGLAAIDIDNYTAFHIEAVQTFVSDQQSLSDRYAGNDPLQIMSSGHRSYCFRQ